MRAVVHIGFNKCGSTAIQKWLAANHGALAARGFAHRRTDPRPHAICSNPQFADLAFSEAGEAMPARAMSEVLGYEPGDLQAQRRVTTAFAEGMDAWLSAVSARTVLISNEFLGPWLKTPALVQALDRWLSARFETVRYVAYIRAPVQWLVSVYGQSLKRRAHLLPPFDTFARRHRVPFREALGVWRDTVGPDRLDVRAYQENWRMGPGLMADYCTAVGLEPAGLPVHFDPVNLSYSDDGTNPSGSSWQANLPDRPRPSAELTDLLLSREAAGFDWIGQSFFPGRSAEFADWVRSGLLDGALRPNDPQVPA